MSTVYVSKDCMQFQLMTVILLIQSDFNIYQYK